MAVNERMLPVGEYPWYQPGQPETIEQFAFDMGLQSARIRDLLDDPSQNEIVNWGAGPANGTARLDTNRLKRREDVGLFGLFTTVAVSDMTLHRKLLHDHFDMPAEGKLSLAIVDYNQPNPVARSREAMVLLNGLAQNGVETWYVYDMPVDPWIPLALGHDWGFRKSLHDLTIERNGATARTKTGELVFALTRVDAPENEDASPLVPMVQGAGMMNMATIDPKHPDTVLRWFATDGFAVLEEASGFVSIEVDPTLEWAELLPANLVAPGCFLRGVAAGDLVIQKIR